MKFLYAQIAVAAPIKGLLTYLIPEFLTLKRGDVVMVPLARRKVRGLVFQIEQENQSGTESEKIKTVLSKDQEFEHTFQESYMAWIEWLADYYFYPIGLVASLLFPPLEKKDKVSTRKKSPIPVAEIEDPYVMNTEQQVAFDQIIKNLKFSSHLIFGVTGSGKTEIYLHLFEHILKEGKAGLFLLPEISLTPQLVNRFARRFGSSVALLHSQLTDRERTQFWWNMIDGKAKILIGARSALFCPIPNLGLVIVDEEHEASFKQDDKLKYHGRDAAIMLARLNDCPVILGSATPSLESWNNALTGKYTLHTLTKRVGDIQLPKIEIVDLKKNKEERSKKDFPFWLSQNLFEAMTDNLAKEKQIALFLNRRGMSQTIICPLCGYTKDCPNCDIKLSLHAHTHLVCHYCDYHESFKKKCPDCREGELETLGIGTEAVEIEMKKLFPQARICRVDRDEIQNRNDMEDVITRMESQEIDILIGTQMISKGLDFPNLKLVGLILADIGFNMPDFRSGERSYQLITQMSGRAGRHLNSSETAENARGHVILQTFNPENESVLYALNANFQGFAEYDLRNRSQLNYPPFGKIVAFRIQSKDLGAASSVARKLSQRCHGLKEQNLSYQEIDVLGPTESPIAKIRGEYRFQLLLKSTKKNHLHQFVKQVLHNEKWIPSAVRIITDVDPQNLL